MSPLLVQARIAEIVAVGQDDDERAHGLEDDLRGAVLLAIAEGRCEDPQECARLALTTDDLTFCRWCA